MEQADSCLLMNIGRSSIPNPEDDLSNCTFNKGRFYTIP